MEFKKKTIIWEDNNEPPKDYIGIKSDNKAYEFDYTDRTGKESNTVSVESGSNDQECGELKKFADLTIDDINYMMDYPEDLPVCDVMGVFNGDEIVTTDTFKINDFIDFYFSTQEKAQEAFNNGSYGRGTQGVQIKEGSIWNIYPIETSDGKTIYEIKVHLG